VAPRETTPPLKIHKLTWVEMEKCLLKGFCYNYDEKYSSGHKCKEHNYLCPFMRTFMMLNLNERLKRKSSPPPRKFLFLSN
jgi:hypothetical protein